MEDRPEYVTAPVLEQAREPFDGATGVDGTGNWVRLDLARALWQWDVMGAAFDFCACGNPEIVEDAMLAYLDGVIDLDNEDTVTPDGWRARCGGEVAFLLLAYLADQQKWTKHGGSVYGAWITDKGRQTRAALAAAKQTRG